MINANPAEMPLFTREVLKAIDAMEQLTKAYDGPLFKRCNKALGLKGSRSILVWIVSRQELAATQLPKTEPPTSRKPIDDCEETIVLAKCGSGELFIGLARQGTPGLKSWEELAPERATADSASYPSGLGCRRRPHP